MAVTNSSPGLNTVSSAAKLGLGTILLYNLAGFGFNLYDTVLYAWLPYLYAPPADSGRVQYVSLALFGLILAGGRILDAVTDPLVGFWSDKTTSRWGRRKPFIFVSAPILLLTFVLVWRPPVAGPSLINALYLGAVLFVYYWAYTGMLIPWLAVVPEMSPNNDVRVKIITIGIVIGVFGALVGGGLSGPLIQNAGPTAMALILGGIAFVLGEMTLWGVRENHRPAEEVQTAASAKGLLGTMKDVFWDKHVAAFSGMIMLVQMTYQLTLMNIPYLTTLVLGRTEAEASMLMAEIIILMAASTPLWYWLLKKYPKRQVMRLIIVAMAVGFGLSFFIGRLPGASAYVQALIILPLAALPMGGMFTASLALITDLTDYGELKDGQRTEAIYYGIYGIVRKAGWALCSVILSLTFSAFGYSAANPLGVRVIWLICAACCLVGLLLFIPYKLGDSKEETGRLTGLG